MAQGIAGRERRRERVDRGIKVRTEDIYALLSWREICYLMVPRAALVIGMLVVPALLSELWQRVICLAGIYALLALAFDFLLSSVGLVCLGGALWMGVGGYITGILASEFGLSPALTVPVASFAGGLFCTLLFLPCLPLRGIYFAIATFVYPLLFTHVIEALKIAGGTFGLPGLPTIPSKWIAIYLVVILLLVVVFGFRRLLSADLGLVLRGIRDNDQAVWASGIQITYWKTVAVFIASTIGCFAGAYLCVLYGWTGMSFFALDFSILPIAAAVMGGIGTFSGALLGSFVLVPLTELLRAFGPLRMVLYAAILAVFVVAKPEGVLPYLTRKYHQFQHWVEV